MGADDRRPRLNCLWCPYADGCEGKCEKDGHDRRSYTLITLIEVERKLKAQRKALDQKWGFVVAFLGGLLIGAVLLIIGLATALLRVP